MTEARAYTGKQFALAVCLAALLGWAAFAAPVLVARGIQLSSMGYSPFDLALLVASAVVGLPIAFIACWVIAAPVLWFLMETPVGWMRAIFWGLSLPGGVALAVFVVTRIRGLRIYLDPNVDTRVGGGDNILEVNGILTPNGWYTAFWAAVIFIGASFATALVVRAIVGPGRREQRPGGGQKSAAE